MPDFSLLPMLQRRMAAAQSQRPPFPRDERPLRQRLDATRARLWDSLGAMPEGTDKHFCVPPITASMH